MTQTKKQIGQRGKSEEKIVQEILTRWNIAKNEFAVERLPDSRSAQGAIKAQVSDFMVGITSGTPPRKRFILLEVKATQHDYRIAKSKLEQLPRIKKWMTACATGIVLVHHTTLKLWRLVDADWLELGKPSWDLSHLPLHESAEEALTSHPAFMCFREA